MLLCPAPRSQESPRPITLLGPGSYWVTVAVFGVLLCCQIPFQEDKANSDIIALPAFECHYSRKKNSSCLAHIQAERSPSPTSARPGS